MQTKYEKYEQLSHDTLHSIVESKDNWLKFLDTASRMYKYSFEDQVLIHAQRPDTRACADFAFWTAENRMNRHIKRHSDGIALLDRDKKKLHYVYAVEDTEARANGKSRDPEAYIWQLSQENRAVINTMLCDQGSIQSENIEKTIVSMAYSMARLKTADYANELDKMYDSLSPSIQREEFRTAFATFVAESSAYMAARRTGTDVSEYLSKNQFANLYLFQNTYITGIVGEATADTAQAVLRQIERNVNEYKRLERSVGNGEYQREQRTQEESSERNTLRSGREDTDLSSVRGRGRGGRTDSDRTLREAEREVSQGELQGNLQHDAASEHADTTLTGDRRTGVGEVRSDSEGISGSGRNGRGTEDERSARMGRSNEQLQGDSSGNSYQGDSGDRNRQYNISNEAEVINTSAFSYDEAIHSAFAEVSLNHSFSDKQQKFLDRIENFAVRNNVTENMINAAFERAAAFHNTYGNREYVSRNIFARRLGSIEKELEEAIRKNSAIVEAENVVITHSPIGYDDPYCLSRVNENGDITDYYHDKNGDIPVFMNINAAQEYAARHGLKIKNSDESKKFGTQALVTTEINGEISYFKFTGMNLEDIMSVAADNGSLQDYEKIGTRIGETEFAEIQQSTDFSFSVDFSADEDTISIYTVNNGLGGIAESDRNDDNIRIEKYKLSEYLRPNGATELPIDTAKRLISEYIEQEYNSEADFSDISSINIAYTSIVEIDNVPLNDELELQVSVDLENYTINSYIDGDLVHSEKYDSIEAMLPALNNLDFNELTSTSDYEEEIKSILADKQAARAIDINEALADPIGSPEDKAELQRELDSITGNTTESVTAAQSIPPLHIEKYGLTLDFSEVSSLDIEWTSIEYVGGIDSDGHERKDNFTERYSNISFYDGGYPDMLIRYDGTAEYATGDYPVPAADAAAEIEEYLDKSIDDKNISIIIKNKDGSENYINAEKLLAANTVIDIPEYDISVNLREIDTFTIEDTAFQRNNERVNRALTIYLNADGTATSTVTTEGSSDKPTMNFDLSDETEVKALKDLATDFIIKANNEALNIYTLKDGFLINSFDIDSYGFVEEIGGNDENTRYRISENNDEQYKFNVQILSKDSSGDYVYSGNGRFTETLDEAREYVRKDKAERSERESAEKSTTTVKGEDLNIGDKVLWEGDPYIIESKGGLLGMKPLFETNVSIVSPSMIWQGMDFEVYEFAAPQQALASEFTEQEMLDVIGNYRYISTPKQDVVAHFNEHTDTDNRADYLRSIYNDDYSELIINDSRYGYKAQPDGLLLWKGSFLSSDEKQTISWEKVSELTAQLIDNEDFLGIDDIAETNDDMEQLSLFGDMSLDDEPTVQDIDELPVQNDIAPTVQTEVEPTVQVEAPAAKKPVGDKKDFVITNENLGESGAKTKYRANVAAIRTLKEIEAENRLATAAEQQILSQYVGWGGLKNAFEDFHDDWKNEYAELKELLTPEEYSAAAASVLNAHYTSPVVISAMYDALKENGFTGGRILEPAMGVGNFFGVMPTDIRDNSKLYGVELDSISGRIAQQLYQSANIKITGFEKTDIKNDTFDLAVGNVPFGGYSLNEAAYNRYHFQIHDHFFAKSLDKVKPNGIVAFITSKGTMDKNNPAIRKYIAERAELVGAIRLPNNAFKGNAGTEVTSDIIFLQKREYPIELTQDNMPSWIDLGKTEDGLTVNQYFIDNPDMVLGKIVEGNKLYGHGADDTMCIPIEGADLKEQLAAAIKNIRFKATAAAAETSEDIFDDENIDIPLNVRNFSYAVIADNVYYRNNSDFEKFEGKKSDIPRIKGMIEIRDCLREVISCQIDNGSDEQLQALQEQLNSLYDSYVEKYGRLNTKQNIAAFKEDSAAPLLTSLEQYKGEEFIGKAAIFSKRTILAKTDVTSVDTAAEALTLSLAKKAHVDMPYMQQLTGFTAEKIMEDLKGVVFENPMKMDDSGNPHLEAADEYLSGNIRKKLEFMKENYADDSRYSHNIEALERAMPTRLQAADIDIKLGAPCVPKEFVQQFMYESFGTPNYMREMNWNKRSAIRVDYSELTSRWSIPNKSHDKENAAANAKYGTKRKTAYEILEDCLNLQSTTVKDRVERDGKEVSVINQTETEFAQEKQRQLQEAFKKWIYAEPARREEVVERYNVMFNSTRPREYDGSALEFPGMNNEIKLRKHQRDAVAHALYGGNTLFAHEVGAGKTFEMIAAAMEGKRLGLHNKALLCVPNHLTEQEGADFIKLYPNANILVATADDFSKKNRRRLFAKIATGDYDCVIIGHSQLINLPISRERQERLLNEQINDIIEGVAALKAEQGDNFQIKQMEKTRKSLEAKLEKLTQAPVRDDVVNFEELGIDKLIIDEAHMFKNLFISTKMSNISGISTNDNVQKTMDLYLKTQYLDEITGGKGVIFATGTPVSNSISEIYSMMKYLQNDLLEETGLKHFDMWAANFAETVTESQLSPEGNSYQMKTRFARFNNMPELMALFKECADIKTTDQLGLKIPECEMHTVVAQPSEIQKKLIENLSERAKRIRLRQVKPTEDNMPMITNDGRKIGLDVRLMNPDLPDDENSKLNVCINNVYNIWERTAEQKSTQVIFCDLGVPQSSTDEKKNGKKFSVYDDIKEKLIQKGVPAEEIAFIHSAKTEEAKDKLFAKVRKGEIRVLIGSTQKMGAGTNIQDKLIASHDLDAPWKPSDMEQRRGRMVRQGNENEKVDLYRYVTEGTFDAYLYQMLENKQKFISQIMTSKSPVRSCQDLDEVSLSYAEIKALSAGNPLIKEKMDLDIEVSKLKMLKASHMNALYDLQDKVMTDLPAKIKFSELLISNIEKDIKAYSERPIVLDDKGKPAFPSIELFGKVYTDKDEAGKALIEACRQAARADITRNVEVGSYQGFKLNIGYEPMNKVYVATLSGSATYKTELGGSESGNFTRLDNALNGMEDKLTAAKQQLERLQNQLEEAMAQLDTPFPHEQELQEKSQRLDELTKQLESAADDKPTSELAEIVDPYFIEVSSEEAADKLKSSGITFELKESEGHYIVKINRSDKDKVHDLLEQQKKIVL